MQDRLYKFDDVLRCLTYVANEASAYVVYNKEKPGYFSDSTMKSAFAKLSEYIDFNKFVDSASIEQLQSVGFSFWYDDLLLIPIWIYSAIPDDLVLTSINGDSARKCDGNVDTDIRVGCIAYGIRKQAKDTSIGTGD